MLNRRLPLIVLAAVVHAPAQGQSRGVAGSPQRRRTVRHPARLPVSQAESGARPPAGRGAHQLGPDDFSADHPLDPAGIAGHLGHADGHSHRGITHLRPPALSTWRGRTDPRASQRDRRSPESDCDGQHPRRGAHPPLQQRRNGPANPCLGATAGRDRERPSRASTVSSAGIRLDGQRGAIPLRPCDRSAARRILDDLL
jgi:hypothetical protein